MNKTWLVIEKILGVLITAWGAIVLYSVVNTIFQTIDSGYVTSGKTSYADLIKHNHLSIITSIIAVFGGFFILFNDQSGWVLSVVSAVMFAIMLFISSRVNSGNTELAFSSNFKSYGLLSLLFFAFLVLLVQKPFRYKYKAGSKQWLIIAVILGLLILDKIIF